MANFRTHLFVAAGVSGVLAIACLTADIAEKSQAPLLFGLGTLGGLLPDIDVENSKPVRISFNLLAFGLASLVMFEFVASYTIVELLTLWLGVFVLVRYGVLDLFNRFTQHRGVFHSWLAALFFGLVSAGLAHYLFRLPYSLVWLSAAFVIQGFLVHLTLDELFGVDLLNRRIKRSFGTALKPLSLTNWQGSVLLLLLCAAIYSHLPKPAPFISDTWQRVQQHYRDSPAWFMPVDGHWFRRL